MKAWLKENLVLVSGIVLPVLLVGAFFVLNSAPRFLSDPPTTDFVLVAYQYDYQHVNDYSLSFEVRDGKLTGKVSPRNQNNANERQVANIFRYNVAQNTFEEIVYDLPENLKGFDEPVRINLPNADHLHLDKRKQSPDGYTFEFIGYRGVGLLGELFGMRRRSQSGYELKKGNARFALPKPASNTNYYQNNLQFMGWVVEEDSEQ